MRRSIPLQFYVSEEEKQLIQEKMELLGTDCLSAYLRKMAIDGQIIWIDLPELKELVSLLRYTSNNVNQLARRVNSGGRVYGNDLSEIRQSLDSLWLKADEILKTLSMIR